MSEERTERAEALRDRILVASGHQAGDFPLLRQWLHEDLGMEFIGPFPESVAWYRGRFVPFMAELASRLEREPSPSPELLEAASEACFMLNQGAIEFWEGIYPLIPVPALLASLSHDERTALCDFIALASSVLPPDEDPDIAAWQERYGCGE